MKILIIKLMLLLIKLLTGKTLVYCVFFDQKRYKKKELREVVTS